MSSHYHAIVWIDHHEARIFHFNVSEVDRLVLHPRNPTRHIHTRPTVSAVATQRRIRISFSAWQTRSPMLG